MQEEFKDGGIARETCLSLTLPLLLSVTKAVCFGVIKPAANIYTSNVT
jgi:hypothetical protein